MAGRLEQIAFDEFNTRIFKLFDKDWLVLTSGDYEYKKFNAMTISWGSLGTMWNRPFVMVVVRPTRYTFDFINKFETFSLCGFPEKYHETLNFIGSKSGRDMNKIEESGITPIELDLIDAPGYAEADLIFQCRRIYWEDFDSVKFLDCSIDMHYPKKDYHRMIFGQILDIRGDQTKYKS